MLNLSSIEIGLRSSIPVKAQLRHLSRIELNSMMRVGLA